MAIAFTRDNPVDLFCSKSDESWREKGVRCEARLRSLLLSCGWPRVGIDKRHWLEARFNRFNVPS
jgi:hypothetical protein